MEKILVLANDMTHNGMNVGPFTRLRIEAGLRYALEYGHGILFIAGRSPRHLDQSQSMAALMAQELAGMKYGHQIQCCTHEGASEFRTVGEIDAALSAYGEELTAIVSDRVHLRRVKLILIKRHGREVADRIKLVPTSTRSMSIKARLLEPLKCLYMRLAPVEDARLWHTLNRILLRWGINVSY